jgi:DHA1 family multidrug resistance protein-like MFS transporter
VDDRPSAGAPLLPHAVRLPAPAAPVSLEAPATAPEPAPAQAPARAPADPVSDSQLPAEEPAVSPHDARSRWSDLGWHTALFAAAQLVLVLIGLSWLADLAASGDMGSFLASGGSSGTKGLGNFFYHAGKIWVIVFLVDVAWTVVTGTRPRESDRGR